MEPDEKKALTDMSFEEDQIVRRRRGVRSGRRDIRGWRMRRRRRMRRIRRRLMGEVGVRSGRFESGWVLVVFLVCIDRLHFS